VTYPNVLVLDYLKQTGRLTPETQLKAERYIGLGYQRLLTFEVAGGGFSLFGRPPAILNLSAYGLLEFSDMARVYSVDPALIQRTATWLRSQQKADGTWGNNLTDTAFVTWALIEAGQSDTREAQRGLNVLKSNWGRSDEPYVLALIANALAAAKDPAANEVLAGLEAIKIAEGDAVHWTAKGPSIMGSHGRTGDVETTALVVHAMLRANQYPQSALAGLTYLIRQKDSFGTWYSTQATILSLKALTLAATQPGMAEGDGQVIVSLNGAQKPPVAITKQNADVVHSLVFDDIPAGDNAVAFQVVGSGNLMYQVSAEYYLPWDRLPLEEKTAEQMAITVDYDRRSLAVNDEITARVQMALMRDRPAVMVVADLGIPPGFAVETGDLERLVADKRIQRFEVTGRQIILYVENMQPKTPLEFTYRLRAKFPIKAKVPPSAAYDYYNPDAQRTVEPVGFVVE
jgi:hypothetical protein